MQSYLRAMLSERQSASEICISATVHVNMVQVQPESHCHPDVKGCKGLSLVSIADSDVQKRHRPACTRIPPN